MLGMHEMTENPKRLHRVEECEMRLLKVSVMLCALVFSRLAFAQVSGSISGVVTDSSGAVVAGAKIRATNRATNAVKNSETNSSGSYSITNLAPGPYEVVIEKPGFETTRFNDNELTVAQALVINARLTIGAVSQVVQVNGSATTASDTSYNPLRTC